jgi:8-hydroxy-5-deazaflavin:NADPH oxidoreductase
MKIGILGAGNIGGNLGRRWAKHGHTIRFGVRDSEGIKDLVAECGAGASAGDVRSAAQFADVILLSVPWMAVPAVLEGAGDLRGKILIDATNALKWGDVIEIAVDTSAAQTVAAMCPGAKVVKAFNTLGAEHILNPIVADLSADVFLCADDAEARETVKKLAEEVGFHVVDMGPLRNARVTEHIAIAWIYLAMKAGHGRNIAFKVLGAS